MYADQDVLELGILPADVVQIVGGDQRNVEPLVQLHQPLVDGRKLRHATMLHQLKVVAAESLSVPGSRGPGVFHAPLCDETRDLAAGASRENDQSFAVLLEKLPVCSGLIVESLQMRLRNQLDAVMVAGGVLREHCEVERALVPGVSPMSASGRDVHLATDYRLDAGVHGNSVKVDGPVEPAVVCNREAVHPELFRALNERFEAAQSVQHAELGVDVEMRKQISSMAAQEAGRLGLWGPGLRPGMARQAARLGPHACYAGRGRPSNGTDRERAAAL